MSKKNKTVSAAPIAPKVMKVRASRHAMDQKPRQSFAEMFPVAPSPPGVPDAVTMAMDDAMQPFFGYANAGIYGEGAVWLGFPYLAELTQRPEYRMITEVRAKEMTRKGFELTYTGDDDKRGEERLKELDRGGKDFQVLDKLRIAAEHDGFFGGGQVYIDTGDADRPSELQSKLIIDKAKIPKGSLRGFKNIEPMWSYPGVYNANDPLHDEYFKPQTWYVNGKTVHVSRLLTMISRQMPDILKPAYSFRGLSLSQMAKPYVDNWLRTRQSVSDLLHSFSIIVILSNLQGALQGEPWDNIYARVDEFNALRDNRGAFVGDKDTEDFKLLAVPLSGLDSLQAQSQEQMASVSQTPLVKLLGIQPAGLNASSDGEIRVFYDTIHALQEHLFSNSLKIMLDCIQLHLWGEIDQDIGFKWVPLWQLDEAALASVRKTEADTAGVLIQEGVISPEEERTRLAGDADSPYHGLEGPPPEPPEEDFEEGLSGDPAKGIGESKKEQRSVA